MGGRRESKTGSWVEQVARSGGGIGGDGNKEEVMPGEETESKEEEESVVGRKGNR